MGLAWTGRRGAAPASRHPVWRQRHGRSVHGRDYRSQGRPSIRCGATRPRRPASPFFRPGWT